VAPSEQIEVELKFDVDAGHTAPDLRILPGVIGASAPETFQLDATYFDTENLDLAGNRITMRRRTGGHDAGWHLKRPTGIAGARRELRIGFGDAPADADVPAELITPVIALTRTRKLIPVAALSTTRTVTTLMGADGRPVAEFAEDLVSAQSMLPGGHYQEWAEWEFELLDGGRDTRLLKAAEKLLRNSGGRTASSASKLARAIGSTPTVVEPHLGRRPTALDLVVTDIAIHRNSLVAYDPQVRIDAEDAVHQMRVACRRLRILGDARDSEVQIAIDQGLLRSENASAALVAELTGTETTIHDRAIKAAHSAMNSARYFALLDSIDELIASPPPGPDADIDAVTAVDRSIEKNRKSIRKAQKTLAAMTERSPEWEEQLHTIRKRAKRLRYSTDAAEPLGRKRYKAVAKAAKRLQSSLGDYNDTRINRQRLGELAATNTLSGPDMFVLGRIDARQEVDGERALADYRKAAKDL
jgi:CHAD domain-containing protein